MRSQIVAAALALALGGGVARGEAKRPLTVEGISLKLWDETTGKVVPFDKPPNPYGLNLTLMVLVKVKGPTSEAPKSTLTLEVSAPDSADEATGEHPAWNRQFSRPVWSVGEKGVAQFVFVMPYECAEEATFSAAIGASTKKVKLELPCAE